jgi:hypothetical protein
MLFYHIFLLQIITYHGQFRPLLQRFRYQIRRVMTLTFTLFFVTFILERKSLNYKILSTNLLLIKYSTK